ncbi:chromosome partitioning protein [Micromonospora sp. WMMD1082]|uniref:MinD/ParA family ATP-binding protein n=1 Tax=Micromonospora sp. WMMD1082 TaxID=3016104 RepID=UPI0024180DEF|nr:chromosome partitioning protein [Micromonospora sp. WMMD1082]MDG4794860.1 chromosome partitioning protein [Micromonospora sp. WMMD1082]
MVDENADRVHVTGQHGVPERDIEPLWPPDQIDGFGAPGWDAPPPAPPAVPPAPTQPSPAPPHPSGPLATGHGAVPPPPGPPAPAYPAPGQQTPNHPTSGPPTPDHPSPGYPNPGYPAPAPGYPAPATGHPVSPPAPATGHPPSPADYPSLSGGGPAATGWEPNTAPVPPGQPGPAPVDLDLPFTLDRSTSLAPTRDGGPARTGPAGGEETDQIADGGATDAAAGTGPGGSEGMNTDDGGGDGGDGVDPSAARPPAESPWAHPPQRPATDAISPAETADGSPRPSWALPAQPLPPVPQAIPGPPAPQQAGPYLPAAPPPHGSAPVPPHGSAPVPPHGATATPPPGPPPTDVGPPAPYHPGPIPQQPEPPYATSPPGPFPPQPAWNPAPWQQGAPPPVAHPTAQQPYQPANTASRVPPGYPEPAWNPEAGAAPTAEDFARRRQVRPADPVATMGVRAVVNKTGLVKLPPGRHELELKQDIEMVRRNFGGLRQVTVVNPKGGAGKTVAILLLAMTFGQKRGGYVLAWDNNETQGTLGMRAQQDFHSRTVRDLLRDLGQFHGAHGRVGDLSQYVRSQGEGMFDVLASDESATGGEMLTSAAFGEIREVVSRFYKLIFVDTGNNVRAQNWQAAMDATDQLVVTMSARNDSAETAARMLDHLEQSGRQRLVRQAVTVVSMPPSRKEIDLPAIQEHFAARTRAVLLAPYERLIDTGEPLRYAHLSAATRDAWLKIAAAVAEGL